PAGTKFRKRHGWVMLPSGGGGSWSGGGFSGGGGGGGFSGGGGSSGGGGASSSWQPRQATGRGTGPRAPAPIAALPSPPAHGAFPGRPARIPAQGSLILPDSVTGLPGDGFL